MSSENGWAEYQKLVLAELERHNKWLNTIDEKLNAALLTFSAERKAVEALMKMVEQLDSRVNSLEDSRIAYEAAMSADDRQKASRRWLIGLSVASSLSAAAIVTDILVRLYLT